MTNFPELHDRLILPLQFKGLEHAWKFKPTRDDILEKYIIADRNKSLTFVSLEFSSIKLINNPDVLARTVLNKAEMRFEMHFNIEQIKRLYWTGKIERVLRRPFGFAMPDLISKSLPQNFSSLDKKRQDSMTKQAVNSLNPLERLWHSLPGKKDIQPKLIEFTEYEDAESELSAALRDVVHHEFGHLWFWHLRNNKKIPEGLHKFVNIAQDGLLNYNLNIYNHYLNEIEYHNISSWYLALIPFLSPRVWSKLAGDFYHFSSMSTDEFKKEFKNRTLTPGQYKAWRVLSSQFVNFKKVSIKKNIEKTAAICNSIITMSKTAIEIAKDIKALFPDDHSLQFNCSNQSGASDDNYIDITDLDISELPPQFGKLLEEQILPGIGVGGKFYEELLKRIEEVKVNKQISKTLSEYAEKDPSRYVTKMLKTEKLNKVESGYRPTKHPSAKSFAMSYALARSDPPKFFPKTTAQETKSLNALSIYFDVSGSFMHMTSRIIGFLRELEKEFSLRLWQFSEEIQPMTKEDLLRGVRKSTGGTNGNCIVEHMRKTCDVVSNFIVLGDRYYGDLSRPNFPKPITILDMTTTKNITPWFKSYKNVRVGSVIIDNDFCVVKEEKPK